MLIFARCILLVSAAIGRMYEMIGISVGCSLGASPSLARYCTVQDVFLGFFLSNFVVERCFQIFNQT